MTTPHTHDKPGAGSLYGTLEVLILRVVQEMGPVHGLDVAREIRARSDDLLRVEEGALYPALHRLQRQGQVRGEWRISPTRRRARFYEITPTGQRSLAAELGRWKDHARGVNRVLGLGEA